MSAPADGLTRGQRKTFVGVVVGDKMQKTIVVQVERHGPHPAYGKVVRQFTRFKAHDERREAKTGDLVRIVETRPLSKDKRWRLVEILRRGGVVTHAARPGEQIEGEEAVTSTPSR